MPKEKKNADPLNEEMQPPLEPEVIEETRAQGPIPEGDDRVYTVNHTVWGPFPRGYTFTLKTVKDIHPGFAESDLTHALKDHPGVGPAIKMSRATPNSEPPPPSPDTQMADDRKAAELREQSKK